MFSLAPSLPNADTQPDKELADLPVLQAAVSLSPYLQRLCRTRPETLELIRTSGAETSVTQAINRAAERPGDLSMDELRRKLRHAKADIHLSLAALDLACTWDWEPVTRAFSNFADAAIDTALRAACDQVAKARRLDWSIEDGTVPGLFVLALGKLGAHELNYSSDVDIVAMYDPETFPANARIAADSARRIIQEMSRILEEQTENGYVLRVDHRLRPDPRSTPVAVSTEFADNYYESVGQNWERMAYIKARPCGGDRHAARAFLDLLEPFVWRRHLDFWALEDIRAIKQQIHTSGGHKDLDTPEFDVKLGRGGIREIEFFAQTQQLIHGGRNRELRKHRTVNALKALCQEGHVSEETATELSGIYGELRGIEHRIQMLNDEHTHTLQGRDAQRERVARLSGYSQLQAFDDDVRELRQRVRHHYSELFHAPDELGGVEGNLVFTGVDIDPETVKTLEGLGFSNPERIIADVQSWHRGNLRATRAGRSRQLLTALEPRLFQHMAETGNPDAAFDGFRNFLAGLSGGVQTLSLLAANPVILSDLIRIFSMAPGLARDLSGRPNLLEGLLDGGFKNAISEDTCGNLESISDVITATTGDYEWAMNEVRRNFRDEHFRIRFRLLKDTDVLRQSGRCFAQLANVCIRALEPYALREAERKLGDAPGSWVICGLGKLGDGDLTARSDLDLMVIYDQGEGEVGAQAFYTRATQRLITALSAQTEEGLLYEADMQLRPSGRAGPVAVSFASFGDYYQNEAWTWEHMALTRLRTIAGDADLAERVMARKDELLSIERPAEKILTDVWDMRERLLQERPAKHDMDVKLIKGGMIDIEFLAQTAQLLLPHLDWTSRTVASALETAGKEGLFTSDETRTLTDFYRYLQGIQAYERAALDSNRPAEQWPAELCRLAARALKASDFQELKSHMLAQQESVWALFCRKLQPGSTEWTLPPR